MPHQGRKVRPDLVAFPATFHNRMPKSPKRRLLKMRRGVAGKKYLDKRNQIL
jgi:hypothetical protein